MSSIKSNDGRTPDATRAINIRHRRLKGICASIARRPRLYKAGANFGWLLADKILRMAGGILLAIWLARYLGAQTFGTYSYVIAFVALFAPIASLGLNEIVVRDLVRNPGAAGSILGTAAVLTLIGGCLAFASCLLGFILLPASSSFDAELVAILGIALLLRTSDVVKYWYQSLTLSRLPICIEGASFVLFWVAKMIMIALQAPLLAFIIAIAGEALISAIGLAVLYIARSELAQKWSFDRIRAKELLTNGMPILLSGGLVLLNINIDKVMLGRMSGATEVGLYSAVSRLTEAWYFLPVIAGMTVAPRLNELFARDHASYLRVAQLTFNLLTIVAIVVCTIITSFSDLIVKLLYGEAFAAASPMLIVHVWTALFVFHVSVRTQLLVIERRQTLILGFALFTLGANIFFNLFAIPIAGGLGASYASLISWAMCVLIFPLAFKASRCYPAQFLFFLRRTPYARS